MKKLKPHGNRHCTQNQHGNKLLKQIENSLSTHCLTPIGMAQTPGLVSDDRPSGR